MLKTLIQLISHICGHITDGSHRRVLNEPSHNARGRAFQLSHVDLGNRSGGRGVFRARRSFPTLDSRSNAHRQVKTKKAWIAASMAMLFLFARTANAETFEYSSVENTPFTCCSIQHATNGTGITSYISANGDRWSHTIDPDEEIGIDSLSVAMVSLFWNGSNFATGTTRTVQAKVWFNRTLSPDIWWTATATLDFVSLQGVSEIADEEMTVFDSWHFGGESAESQPLLFSGTHPEIEITFESAAFGDTILFQQMQNDEGYFSENDRKPTDKIRRSDGSFSENVNTGGTLIPKMVINGEYDPSPIVPSPPSGGPDVPTSTWEGWGDAYIPDFSWVATGTAGSVTSTIATSWDSFTGLEASGFPMCVMSPIIAIIGSLQGMTLAGMEPASLQIQGGGAPTGTQISLIGIDQILADTGAERILEPMTDWGIIFGWMGIGVYILRRVLNQRSENVE